MAVTFLLGVGTDATTIPLFACRRRDRERERASERGGGREIDRREGEKERDREERARGRERERKKARAGERKTMGARGGGEQFHLNAAQTQL